MSPSIIPPYRDGRDESDGNGLKASPSTSSISYLSTLSMSTSSITKLVSSDDESMGKKVPSLIALKKNVRYSRYLAQQRRVANNSSLSALSSSPSSEEGNFQLQLTSSFTSLIESENQEQGPFQHSFQHSSTVDFVDAKDEDSFTLEPFDSLIRKAQRASKCFILARVTTVDPHDSSRHYHSHYPAHLLNKILFRTEPEAGLLHRMKCRNPRNNMEIIGPVEYWVITPAAMQKALSIWERAREGNQIRDSRSLISELDGENSTAINQNNSFVDANTTTLSSVQMAPGEPMLIWEALFYATDDDFLNVQVVREFFKASSINTDDYLLFTLYRTSLDNGAGPSMGLGGEATISGSSRAMDPTFVRSWKNLWGTFQPLGPSLVHPRMGFISPKVWVGVMILYMATCVVLVNWVLPKPFWYWAIGLMGILIIIPTLLFVRTRSIS